MRPFYAALLAGVALTSAAQAGDLPAFDDAPLHAVQFVDRNEGWAVGDDGVVWHTIDGGKDWERQATGVHSSLRSVHFLNPYTGWIAGREELPNGAGSNGVLLFTKDGGLKWQLMTLNSLPGLHRVRFIDLRTGFVIGDGCDQFPSGVFMTTDAGRTWQPLPGPRVPGWQGGDFTSADNGALGGAWNRLASVRGGKVIAAKVDTLGGRTVRDLRLLGKTGVAVGHGGLVLLQDEKPDPAWEIADLPLSADVRANLDFNAVASVGKHIWVAGRPGTLVLHTADQGATWEVQRTEQALPINGLHFLDERTGWAVGEFGTILTTIDGGTTWKTQRHGGQRAAVMFIHARSTSVPVEAIALLGGEEGYLTATLRVVGPDPASAALIRASDEQRLQAAIRMAGGTAGEMLWQFPAPQHLGRSEPEELVKNWDLLHANQAAEQLLRQLVLAIRIWQPSVIVTDSPEQDSGGFPSEMLVGQAVKEAMKRAADPSAFPEHGGKVGLGLQPWQASKLYARTATKDNAQVVMDLTEAAPRLESTPRDFAAPASALLSDTSTVLPSQCYFRLLHYTTPGAPAHRELMAGLPPLANGGLARRSRERAKESAPEVVKAIQARRNLQALAELPTNDLVNGDKLLAQIKPALDKLPDHQAAPAAFAVGQQYARQGQWLLARETFLMLVERYPTHPLAADACRWLIRHDCSSETRRRQELKQFIVVSRTRLADQVKPGFVGTDDAPLPGKVEFGGDNKQRRKIDPPEVTPDIQTTRYVPGEVPEAPLRWYQQGLNTEKRLTGFGPLFASDPSIQFCLQAARRNLGDFETPRKWYSDFAARQPDGPWRAAAQAELWLAHRSGVCPKPVGICRRTEGRPYLDGKLDEPCWQSVKPMGLKNAVGETAKEYPTEAWLAYDQDFLYVALRCRHPEDRYVAPVKGRPRDADLRAYDRVGLMLDLDRDYSTYFHLQVDQRGCVCDDCWGDIGWNPRWFVAIHSDKTSWQIEAAIPLTELSGEKISLGKAWAFNIVRVLPGRGVQAYSIPADVQPRPEGMGLLIFTAEEKANVPEAKPMPMSKAP
jgi:photosystem II stability/assembly factor-like uncharacterized protein